MERLGFWFMLIVIGSACRPAYHYTPDIMAHDSQPAVESKIIFMTFRIQADSATSGNTISLLSSRTVAGTLKSTPEQPVSNNTITLQQVGASGEILATALLEHPLFARSETVDDNGVFTAHPNAKKDAQFFFRVALLPATTGIRLVETVNGKTIQSVNFPAK